MSVPKHIVALIDAKNEEILRLEREKAESEHALGFAVEAVERLEARGAEMCEVIVKLIAVVELYEPASRHWKLIRRAKAAIGRDEE